jgi:hypothetical protein
MKKTILFTTLLLCIHILFAQENKTGLSISLKGGPTFANMYGNDAQSETFLNGENINNFYANNPASNRFKTGLNYNVSLEYRFCKYFSLGLGYGYIEKGAKINASSSWNPTLDKYENVDGDIYWDQNYYRFTVPITFYLPFKKNDFYVQTGFFKDKLDNSEEHGDIEIAGKDYSYTNNRRPNKNEFGFFLACGYIYYLPANWGGIMLEANWSRHILESAGEDMIPNPDLYYNQTLSFNIGYKYTFNFKNL